MEDLSGKKFNKLTVIKFDRKNQSGKLYWKCKCDCGNIISQRPDSLKSGRKKSCGCITSPSSDEYLKRVEQRLIAQSKRNGECLEWTGRFNPFGYGIFKIRSSETQWLTYITPKKSSISISTHRVAYKIWKGDIPEGIYVLHKCDNRACIEPSHLYLGTHKDNMDDMKNKKRQDMRPGELHHLNKMTNKDVIEIRKLWDSGKETQAGLSRKYNVSTACIHSIAKRKSWKHI